MLQNCKKDFCDGGFKVLLAETKAVGVRARVFVCSFVYLCLYTLNAFNSVTVVRNRMWLAFCKAVKLGYQQVMEVFRRLKQMIRSVKSRDSEN